MSSSRRFTGGATQGFQIFREFKSMVFTAEGVSPMIETTLLSAPYLFFAGYLPASNARMVVRNTTINRPAIFAMSFAPFSIVLE